MLNIRINLKIKARPEQVYHAVTTQEGLSGWWAKDTKAEPAVGFINTFTFGTFINEMKVIKLETNSIAEWECVNSIEEWVGTYIRFDLEEINGQTLLRFTHGGWKAETDMFAGCTYDWARFMTSLKSLCETGTGTPS